MKGTYKSGSKLMHNSVAMIASTMWCVHINDCTYIMPRLLQITQCRRRVIIDLLPIKIRLPVNYSYGSLLEIRFTGCICKILHHAISECA